VRLFFAIELPADIRQKVLALQEVLRQGTPDGYLRYTMPELLHVTLAFLGEVPEENLEEIKAIAGHLCANSPDSRLRFQGIGSFGSSRLPQVIWLGVLEDDLRIRGQTRPLADLGVKLSSACARFSSRTNNEAFENAVCLHVTLARAEPGMTKERAKEISKATSKVLDVQVGIGQVDVSEVTLYESTPGNGHNRYRVIDRFPVKS